MNHKRGKAKAQRAGCLMCKPHKFGHGMENDLSYNQYRKEVIAKLEARDALHKQAK
jgi:hypothetical protein